MKKNSLLLLSILASFSLSACGQAEASKPLSPDSAPSSSEEEGPKPINVFVLSGQSNMEGNTQFDDGHGYLADALEELGIDDADCCYEGIPEVQTSFYEGGAFKIDMGGLRGSNEEDIKAGKFLDTVLGMGADEKQFGPEVGAAYALRSHCSEEEPIYFIKAAFGGSGFTGGGFSKWCWDINSNSSLYTDHLKMFVENNLRLIEEIEGRKPTLKGFLWHQGENDASRSNALKYHDNLSALVGRFREDFADYAIDEDGDNIAFIDCYIFDKGDSDSSKLPSNVTVAEIKILNGAKMEFSEESDMNFIINSSWQYDGGMCLQVNESASGVDHGGVGGQHYWARDMFRLGMAYADVILENGLLD